MTIAGNAVPSGSDISNQPQNINLPANDPVQIPIKTGGIQIINQGTQTIQLCSDQNFTVPVFAGPGVSLPWTTGTTVWVKSPVVGMLLVLPETYNYYNPAVITTPDSPILLVGPLSNIGAGSFTETDVTINSTTRTLILAFSGGGADPLHAISIVTVSGDNGGVYYSDRVYLGNGSSVCKVVVPIDPATDATYRIFVTASPTVTMNVYGDTLQYDESIYYNGTSLVGEGNLAGAGSAVIINGPKRLLTAEVRGAGLAATASVDYNGREIIAVTSANDRNQITFPDNTLLPTGSNISLVQSGAGSSTGNVVYAYP